jgi:hypothetical protein
MNHPDLIRLWDTEALAQHVRQLEQSGYISQTEGQRARKLIAPVSDLHVSSRWRKSLGGPRNTPLFQCQ